MFTRIFDVRILSLVILATPVLLVGCGGDATPPMDRGGKDSRLILCGPVAGEPRQSCTLEVEDRKGDLYLTLRQPTGGFRRLVWPKGGILAPFDGGDRLETTALNGGGVEARIGGWRYRIEKQGGGLP